MKLKTNVEFKAINSNTVVDLVNFDQTWPKENYNDYVTDINKFGYVCYYRDKIVGYVCVYNRSGTKYELTRVLVSPSYRRLGIGSMLIDRVCSLIGGIGPRVNNVFAPRKMHYSSQLFDGVVEFLSANYFYASKYGMTRIIEAGRAIND